MRRIRNRVAGLDVHRDSVTGCVEIFDGVDVEVTKQRFSTTARGIRELADWLATFEVELVVMEATGVYWKPVYYGLEDLFDEVWLVNAHHVKNVPGRKTDMSDAQWLADVAAHGMVRPSMVPPPEIRALRELTRYRRTQVQARGVEIQRLEKLLQDAGIKLTSVASKVWSKSSRAMIEMLISGHADPAALAELAKGRMRSKIPALTEALESRWQPHHTVVARRIMAHIDFLDSTIAELSDEIVERLRPFESLISLWTTIPGVSTLTAQVMIAEIGADMDRFPTAGHLASWAGVAPASYESAGKRRPAGTRHGSRHLRQALIEAAGPRHEPKAPSCQPATAASPDGEDPTKQPSPSLTPSSCRPGTWPSPARPTTTSATTSTTNDEIPPAVSTTTSASSKPPATPSPSLQPPEPSHTRRFGATPRPSTCAPHANK